MPNDWKYSDWWLVAERNLRLRLRAMRVHTDDVDDLVQQTALKALAQEFETEQHLIAWSVVVARNLIVSAGRREARARIARQLAIEPIHDSVEDVVLARLKQKSLADLIAHLPENQRVALGAEFGEINDRRAAGRAAVMRHRTRKRLRSAFDRLGVVLGGWQARLRVNSLGLSEAGGATTAAAAALGLVALGITASVGTLSEHKHHAPQEGQLAAAPVPRRAEPKSLPQARTAPAAETRSEAGASPSSRATFRVPLGSDGKGNSRSLDSHESAPEEEDVLVCIGDPAAAGASCVYWPQPIARSIEQVIVFATDAAP